MRFFNAPLEVGSLAFDSFKKKLLVPYPMFNWILKEARESMQFPDEKIVKEDMAPAPLHLKIAACFRYLANGCPMEANEDVVGLAKSTMVIFAPSILMA